MKRVVRGSYYALSNSVVNSDCTKDIIITDIVRNLNSEIKHICSTKHDSILLDNHEAVKRFSWQTVWMELNKEMPMLLSSLVNNSQEKKPMLCLIASMILEVEVSQNGPCTKSNSNFIIWKWCTQAGMCIQQCTLCFNIIGI